MTDEIYRRPTVERITGLKRATLYKMIALGNFPKQIKLTTRSVGWLKSDIDSWIQNRAYLKRDDS